jgi:ATP-dependent DNA helicase RecQ
VTRRIERGKLDALLGHAKTTACRGRRLPAYFGETYEADCGNCDNCIDPLETSGAGVIAHKALSAPYRTGQRFRVADLTAVLRGEADDRIRTLRHDHLSASSRNVSNPGTAAFFGFARHPRRGKPSLIPSGERK